ncbi:uncharacterized protein LOC130654850 isoform X2 [Hydractinia symbiolongicarpus]|uniref:uncharacterized protein LOC130654850 isoform X2 n=1 Tax=Hydractinia symbiolongicarpus TaxID=13093 RepID=UPI00254AD93E|nr:uncharacterized protein LOC130654850 isoform X2 [Hydractinia symbiolongicarpus]
MKMIKREYACIHANFLQLLRTVLVFTLCVLKHVDGYITRLPCKYHGNFSDIQYNKYSPGNAIKSIQTINRDKCMIECVGESLCKACNYHSTTQLCDLLSSNVAAISAKSGSIYMRTDNTNRNRGPLCKSLNPCAESQMCDDACNDDGYTCVTLQNVASQGIVSLSTTRYPGRYAIDGDISNTHFASTEPRKTGWIKLDLQSTYHVLYVRVWRQYIFNNLKLRVGMSEGASSNPIVGKVLGSGGNGLSYFCTSGKTFLKARYIVLRKEHIEQRKIAIREIRVYGYKA